MTSQSFVKACGSMLMVHLFMTLVHKLWVPFRESDSLISEFLEVDNIMI